LIIVIFTLLFPPDFGGGATRAMNIAKCMVNLGHEVRVISSVPHYPDGAPISKALRFYVENIEGIKVVRLPTIGLPHKGILARFVIFCWYGFFSLFALKMCKGANKIMSFGSHPFADISSYLAKIVTGSNLTIDISDIWPETLELTAKSSLTKSIFNGLGRFANNIVLNDFADNLSVYNERALNFILCHYNYKKKAVVLYNSVDTEGLVYDRKLKLNKKNLCASRHICDKVHFVVLYHGIIGPYQNVENIVRAASIESKDLGRALFIIVGEGESKKKVAKLAQDMHLQNTIILNKLSRKDMAKILMESDLGLVPIVSENPLAIYVAMPSKAAEFLAAGTPILAPKGSFIGSMVSSSNAGFEVDFNDPNEIYKAIKCSLLNPKLHQIQSNCARELAEKRFSLKATQMELNTLLESRSESF
jgi:colanic acid biosynthesis glycosyl transferase WcaI